eukprot:g19868.t1
MGEIGCPRLPRPFLELSSCFTDLSHLAAAESARQVVAASTFRAVAHLLRSSSEVETSFPFLDAMLSRLWGFISGSKRPADEGNQPPPKRPKAAQPPSR